MAVKQSRSRGYPTTVRERLAAWLDDLGALEKGTAQFAESHCSGATGLSVTEPERDLLGAISEAGEQNAHHLHRLAAHLGGSASAAATETAAAQLIAALLELSGDGAGDGKVKHLIAHHALQRLTHAHYDAAMAAAEAIGDDAAKDVANACRGMLRRNERLGRRLRKHISETMYDLFKEGVEGVARAA